MPLSRLSGTLLLMASLTVATSALAQSPDLARLNRYVELMEQAQRAETAGDTRKALRLNQEMLPFAQDQRELVLGLRIVASLYDDLGDKQAARATMQEAERVGRGGKFNPVGPWALPPPKSGR